MSTLRLALLAVAICLVSYQQRGVATPVTPTETGLKVTAGLMGDFTLGYPSLMLANGQIAHKLIEKVIAGGQATLTYDAGAQINIVTGSDGTVDMTLSHIPPDVQRLGCQMQLDIRFANDGKWSIDGKPEKMFPREKGPDPHLLSDYAAKFTVSESDGASVSVTCPPYSYLELTDNRTWNWPIFMLKVSMPIHGDSAQRFVVTGQAPTIVQKKVDQFGQPIHLDYPNKLRSIDELKADVQAEKEYFTSMHPPKLDPFGGEPDSGTKLGLSKTGFFHVEKRAAGKNDPRWYLVDPAGNAFFQLAACAFCPVSYTYVKGREQIYDWIPPNEGEFKSAYKLDDPTAFSFVLANQIRKYGEPITLDSWFDRAIDRARAMGFNSLGAFSSLDESMFARKNFPYVAGLPTDAWDQIPRIAGIHETWDPFDEKNQQLYKKNCEALAVRANDPLLIGYFLVNEPIYEDIPKVVPTLGSKFACKRALVKMLENKYGTINALTAAWNIKAASFDELDDKGLTVSTRAASEDMNDFTGLFFETYFKLIIEGFKQYDKNHMLIGNRLQPGTANNEQLCRISGKYLDVFSLNYYTSYLDPQFVARLDQWTGGKPMLLSEFNFTSSSDSGLGGGGVKNQEERGLAYRNYVEAAAAIPFIVGIEWYTWTDQSVTGQWFSKYNGEAFNTGIFSVADRPYKPMVDQMVKTNNDIYKVMLGERPPFVYVNSKFSQSTIGAGDLVIAHAAGSITIDGSATGWPGLPPERIGGKRLVNGPDSGGVEGSFKMCWTDQNLYFLGHITDPTPMKNSQSAGELWHGDGVELFIGGDDLNKQGPLLFGDRHVLLGATSSGGSSFVNGSTTACKTAVVADTDGKGYTLEAAIPFNVLGFTPEEGQKIRLDIAIDDSADGETRLRQLMWNGTERNSTDRTGWGHATLTR